MSPRHVCLVCVLCTVVAESTVAIADPVDDYVNATLVQHKIPGASVLIVRSGAIVKAQGYGFANLELKVPASADTVYQSGSTGKQFTAAGILLLAEDGKLSLDDRLSTYFPDAPAAWHRISVRNLLTHTSGLRDYQVDLHKDYTEDELLKVMEALPLDFEPGTQWSYSNSGYLLLGLLTSKLTGEHWSDFQAQRLFKPLGMSTTRVISEADIVPNRAAGYELDAKGEVKNQDWVAPSLNRCRRRAVLHDQGPGGLGFRSQDQPVPEILQQRGLGPAGAPRRWLPLPLRIRLVHPRAAWPSADRARRLVAGLPYRNSALR